MRAPYRQRMVCTCEGKRLLLLREVLQMVIQSTSALWQSRHKIVDFVDILRLIEELKWDRLNLSVPHQEQDNWCWAATSDGVAHYYSSALPWTQCAIANADLS